jgi:glutamyl/glutaminyl-tRNA synthetase
MSSEKITRFAPTPSGYLHLGNIYSFVLTHQLAKKEGAKVLLRIDDMDRERTKKKFVKDIFETLDFLEIPYDLGPKNLKEFQTEYSQSIRLPKYQEALIELKDKNLLFSCDCSRNKILKMNSRGFYTGFCRNRKLPFDKKDSSWRIRTEPTTQFHLKDHSGKIVSGKLPGILTDFVVRKKDGLPAYQLSSLVDDIYFGVNLIVRGRDLYGSSLAQVFLSKHLEANDFSENVFLHHPIVKDENDQKLSKSSGSTSIQFLRREGKSKSAIFQLLSQILGLKGSFSKLEDFDILLK